MFIFNKIKGSKVAVLSVLAVWAASSAGAVAAAATTTCPAFGADTDCGAIITITATGATVAFTGQGPYDGFDDTLIGVVNKSKLPIRKLVITSGLAVFGFDGDGIDGFGAPGNSMDTTRYGGPNSYFSNINASRTTGTVNFVTPIAPGGSTYFSLENAITGATACTNALNNGLGGPNGAGTQTISAAFTPKMGFTLAQAASLCGFDNFDWQQTITSWPRPSPLFQVGNPVALSAPPPFLDPPPGGYTYELTHGFPGGDHSYPFYYDPRTTELMSHETTTTLSFSDTPADPCLPGGKTSLCGGKTAPKGSKLAFTTHLVGVVGPAGTLSAQDTGIGFTWTSTFNGTSGAIATTKNSMPPDPGSGTGGVTVTGVQETSTLGGIAVTGINGGTGAPGPLPSGNACNGSFTGTFKGNVTVSNGQDCTFTNGTINGNLTVTGGSLILSGVFVGGNLQIHGGTFSVSSFSAIQGNLEVNNLPSSAVINQICDSTIYGNLQVNNNGAPVEVGATSGCGGNVVGGNLQVNNNTAVTTIVGNTVSGDLQDNNNTGATQVTGNTVTHNLQCGGDTSLTGGSNTAGALQGQCSTLGSGSGGGGGGGGSGTL